MITTTPYTPQNQKKKNVWLFITTPTAGFHLAYLGVVVGLSFHHHARNLGSNAMMRSITSWCMGTCHLQQGHQLQLVKACWPRLGQHKHIYYIVLWCVIQKITQSVLFPPGGLMLRIQGIVPKKCVLKSHTNNSSYIKSCHECQQNFCMLMYLTKQ
jgi:hypothetical protein